MTKLKKIMTKKMVGKIHYVDFSCNTLEELRTEILPDLIVLFGGESVFNSASDTSSEDSYISYYEPETDMEYEKRLIRESSNEEKDKTARKHLFEKLKLEFGND